MEFVESNLKFVFGEGWEVLKYDSEEGYEKASKALPGTKAIDFLCFYKNTLVFFEVKNFQGYTKLPVNEKRLADGMEGLTTEVAHKVRDTVAVICGLARNSKQQQDMWQKSIAHILSEKEVHVIAWVEEDLGNKVLKKRKRSEMSVRTEKLKKKLSWLTNRVFIENVRERHFSYEGLKVNVIEK